MKTFQKYIFVFFLVALVLLCPCFSCDTHAETTHQIKLTGTYYNSYNDQFLTLVNDERQKLGYSPVVYDYTFQQLAEIRSAELTLRYNSKHEHPDGRSNKEILELLEPGVSKRITYGTENTAVCVSAIYERNPARAAFEIWMNSPPHRSSMLNRNVKAIGFSIYKQPHSKDAYRAAMVTAIDPFKRHTVNEQQIVSRNHTKTVTINMNPSLLNLIKDDPQNLYIGKSTTMKIFHDCIEQPMYGEDYYALLDADSGRWESSKPAVAVVDADGRVTAVAEGAAQVRFYINGSLIANYSRMVNVIPASQNEEQKPDNEVTPPAVPVTPTPSEQPVKKGWQGKYYYSNSGMMYRSKWLTYKKHKYYFNNDGRMVTGWKTINHKKYYFQKKAIKNFPVGAMRTGWAGSGRKKYYFHKTSGIMYCNQWLSYGGNHYYFNTDGKIARGWKTIKMKMYYFNSSKTKTQPMGAARKGWLTYQGQKYYFDLKTCTKYRGKHTINNKVYVFNPQGVLVSTK